MKPDALPERLDATYVGEDGQKHRPMMFHRAIFGSYERFIGILIEHYAGKFPLWLAPVQGVVATIVSDADGYAGEVAAKLRAAGIRVDTDLRNEKINYKVREHSLAKVPLLLVVGKREADEGTVALRRLGLGHALRALARDRAAVTVTSDAGVLAGTIDRVGTDHLDLAEHAPGEPRRPAAVRGVVAIAFAGIVAVRSTG